MMSRIMLGTNLYMLFTLERLPKLCGRRHHSADVSSVLPPVLKTVHKRWRQSRRDIQPGDATLRIQGMIQVLWQSW
jgi:hypothetical protein